MDAKSIVIQELGNPGYEVSDEAIECNELLLNHPAGEFYVGRLNYLPNKRIYEPGDAHCAFFTAAERGGTKLIVLSDSVPSGAGEILISISAGLVFSTTQRTVYGHYIGFGEIYWPSDAQIPSERLFIPGLVDNASSDPLELHAEPVFDSRRYVRATLTCQHVAAEAALFTIGKADGEGTETIEVTIAQGDKSGTATGAIPLVDGEHIVISVSQQASGLDNLTLILERG